MLVTVIVVALMAGAASFVGTRLMVKTLRAKAILDHPNERSSHAVPTPVGGGLVVIGVIVVEWLIIWLVDGLSWSELPSSTPLVVVLAAILAMVSWRDDRKPLSPILRLSVQAAAVIVGLAALSSGGAIFRGWLPSWLDFTVTAFLWLWLINLTNFMDGIDGITAVEGASIGIGVALVLAVAGVAVLQLGDKESINPLVLNGVVVAAALAGFVYFNWQPAKIFLGDVGAVPLGFLLGWMLFELVTSGLWAAAILLPLYYVMDASLTLFRRVARRERLMQAHRSHFYQRAARRLDSHARVTSIVLGLNVVLIVLACLSVTYPLPALAAGVVLTAGVLWYFAADASPRPDPS